MPMPDSALSSLRRGLRIPLLCILSAASAILFGKEESKNRFDLPADTADKSLPLFSAQSGMEVLFATEVASNVRTNVVRGEFTPFEAANRLLSGTSLTIVRDDKNSVLRVAAREKLGQQPPRKAAELPATPIADSVAGAVAERSREEAQKIVTLNPFTVTSDKNNSGYQVSNTASANINLEVATLPIAVNVYNRQFIDDVGAADVAEVWRYEPAVSQADIVFAGQPGIRIRGYSAGSLRDGLRFDNSSAGIYIDRMEVIKGAQAVLYGEANPGGYLNVMTKKPPTVERASVTYTLGSEAYTRLDLEFGGPINQTKTLRYYIGTTATDADDWQDFAWHKNKGFFGAIAFNIGSKISLDFDYEHVDLDEGFKNRAIFGSDRSWNPIRTYGTFNTAGNLSFFTSTRHTTSGQIQFRLTDKIYLRAVGRFQDRDIDELRRVGERLGTPEGYRANRDPNLVGTSFLARKFNNEYADARLDLLYNVVTTKHITGRVNVGAKTQNDKNASVQVGRNSAALALDPLRPNFSNEQALFTAAYGVDTYDKVIAAAKPVAKEENDAFYYVMAHIKTLSDRLHMNAGFTDLFNPAPRDGNTLVSQFGALYEITGKVGLYIAYGESFQRQGEGLAPDQIMGTRSLVPVTAVNTEVGIKFRLIEGKVQGTIAYFDSDLQDILRSTGNANANALPIFALSGKENAKGVDFNAAVSITKDFSLIGGFQSIDAKTVSNIQTPALVGAPQPGTPDFAASAWMTYAFRKGPLRGFTLGGGVTYRGKSLVFAASDRLELFTPSFNRGDALLAYDVKIRGRSVRFQLNLMNVTDDLIITGGGEQQPPFAARFSTKLSF
jgi:iron complex outermembrane receptor protein